MEKPQTLVLEEKIMEEPQAFERAFIKWDIAMLKRNRKPVDVMIVNLKSKNKLLGDYAESVKDMVYPENAEIYAQAFIDASLYAIQTSDNKEESAVSFITNVLNNAALKKAVPAMVIQKLHKDYPNIKTRMR